ncbi:MAG: histone H1, partial [Blastocatellia bacterium]
HPKRPRDFSQAAKLVVDIASGRVEDRERTPEEQGKTAAAVARGKAGGTKGGRARAMKLSPEQRAEIARVAAQTRWKKSPD